MLLHGSSEHGQAGCEDLYSIEHDQAPRQRPLKADPIPEMQRLVADRWRVGIGSCWLPMQGDLLSRSWLLCVLKTMLVCIESASGLSSVDSTCTAHQQTAALRWVPVHVLSDWLRGRCSWPSFA
jgi:hypothetical protein